VIRHDRRRMSCFPGLRAESAYFHMSPSQPNPFVLDLSRLQNYLLSLAFHLEPLLLTRKVDYTDQSLGLTTEWDVIELVPT
jgi:hypothetical protein